MYFTIHFTVTAPSFIFLCLHVVMLNKEVTWIICHNRMQDFNPCPLALTVVVQVLVPYIGTAISGCNAGYPFLTPTAVVQSLCSLEQRTPSRLRKQHSILLTVRPSEMDNCMVLSVCRHTKPLPATTWPKRETRSISKIPKAEIKTSRKWTIVDKVLSIQCRLISGSSRD